jgi:midasin
MNVTDVHLSPTFNFYHDPLPQEARLVYEPLAKLIKRCDIILQEYESPILQDAIFLANYMLTKFSPKTAPLMKILTGLELLLNKLEEWEVYASKSLNSCTAEMTLMKQLIIRYRKIQILSWRNLLQWRKTSMMHEDYKDNFLRLAHTLERQLFDRQYYVSEFQAKDKANSTVELKIMEVLDLFMRDSSLGQFQARLAFLRLLKSHFKLKLGDLK